MAQQTIQITKAHGCLNDVILVPAGVQSLFGEDAAAAASAVTYLCDRHGPFGADGVYFIDVDSGEPGVVCPDAAYYNADGSYAEYCGNGLRCVARWLLEHFHTSHLPVTSGGVRFTVDQLPANDEVHQTSVTSGEPVRLTPLGPDDVALVDQLLPQYSDSLRFTALTGPNPHLVTSVDRYDESELVHLAAVATADRRRFADGVNVSMVMPLPGRMHEFFVRTYERGVGLTPSCASGAAAAAATLVTRDLVAEGTAIRVYNVGGAIDIAIRRDPDGLHPTQAGNATFLYSSIVDFTALTDSNDGQFPINATFGDEIESFATLHQSTMGRLASGGIPVDETQASAMIRLRGGPDRAGSSLTGR